MTQEYLEPWLRGTLTEVDAVRRAVLHALELAGEDAERWCGGLTDEEVDRRPFGIAPVAFHLRHMARSLDRLLTYAEGRGLDERQLAALRTEMDAGAGLEALRMELRGGLVRARERVLAIEAGQFEERRVVGRAGIPTTAGGLLIHCAEHTQRHAGQMVTTAKVVMGMRAHKAET